MALATRHAQDPLEDVPYDFRDVPSASYQLDASKSLKISDRDQWTKIMPEMLLLCNEAADRSFARKRGKILSRVRQALASLSGSSGFKAMTALVADFAAGKETPGGVDKPLSLEYIADRVDLDDPIWGYVVRSGKEGWLQGFITITTFTTWHRWFRWDSFAQEAGVIDYSDNGKGLDEAQLMEREKMLTGKIDITGELAQELRGEIFDGDPKTQGVIWPHIAEISLLGALGCGSTLVEAVIHDLERSNEHLYDYIVLQATKASIKFYERMGFVRVGALCRHERTNSEDDDDNDEEVDAAAAAADESDDNSSCSSSSSSSSTSSSSSDDASSDEDEVEKDCRQGAGGIEGKPKRNISSYMLFYKATFAEEKAKRPDLAITQIASQISARWRETGDETKMKFAKLAEVDKKRYLKELEEYNLKIREEEEESTFAKYRLWVVKSLTTEDAAYYEAPRPIRRRRSRKSMLSQAAASSQLSSSSSAAAAATTTNAAASAASKASLSNDGDDGGGKINTDNNSNNSGFRASQPQTKSDNQGDSTIVPTTTTTTATAAAAASSARNDALSLLPPPPPLPSLIPSDKKKQGRTCRVVTLVPLVKLDEVSSQNLTTVMTTMAGATTKKKRNTKKDDDNRKNKKKKQQPQSIINGNENEKKQEDENDVYRCGAKSNNKVDEEGNFSRNRWMALVEGDIMEMKIPLLSACCSSIPTTTTSTSTKPGEGVNDDDDHADSNTGDGYDGKMVIDTSQKDDKEEDDDHHAEGGEDTVGATPVLNSRQTGAHGKREEEADDNDGDDNNDDNHNGKRNETKDGQRLQADGEKSAGDRSMINMVVESEDDGDGEQDGGVEQKDSNIEGGGEEEGGEEETEQKEEASAEVGDNKGLEQTTPTLTSKIARENDDDDDDDENREENEKKVKTKHYNQYGDAPLPPPPPPPPATPPQPAVDRSSWASIEKKLKVIAVPAIERRGRGGGEAGRWEIIIDKLTGKETGRVSTSLECLQWELNEGDFMLFRRRRSRAAGEKNQLMKGKRKHIKSPKKKAIHTTPIRKKMERPELRDAETALIKGLAQEAFRQLSDEAKTPYVSAYEIAQQAYKIELEAWKVENSEKIKMRKVLRKELRQEKRRRENIGKPKRAKTAKQFYIFHSRRAFLASFQEGRKTNGERGSTVAASAAAIANADNEDGEETVAIDSPSGSNRKVKIEGHKPEELEVGESSMEQLERQAERQQKQRGLDREGGDNDDDEDDKKVEEEAEAKNGSNSSSKHVKDDTQEHDSCFGVKMEVDRQFVKENTEEEEKDQTNSAKNIGIHNVRGLMGVTYEITVEDNHAKNEEGGGGGDERKSVVKQEALSDNDGARGKKGKANQTNEAGEGEEEQEQDDDDGDDDDEGGVLRPATTPDSKLRKDINISELNARFAAQWESLGEDAKKQYRSMEEKDAARFSSEMKLWEERHPRKPKRPNSAYFLFSMEVNKRLKEREEGPKLSFKEISRHVSEEWGKLSKEAKEPYVGMRDKESLRYKEELRVYKEKMAKLKQMQEEEEEEEEKEEEVLQRKQGRNEEEEDGVQKKKKKKKEKKKKRKKKGQQKLKKRNKNETKAAKKPTGSTSSTHSVEDNNEDDQKGCNSVLTTPSRMRMGKLNNKRRSPHNIHRRGGGRKHLEKKKGQNLLEKWLASGRGKKGIKSSSSSSSSSSYGRRRNNVDVDDNIMEEEEEEEEEKVTVSDAAGVVAGATMEEVVFFIIIIGFAVERNKEVETGRRIGGHVLDKMFDNIKLSGISSKYRWYLATPKDTPSTIARRFGIRVSDLIFFNDRLHPGLKPKSRLYGGTKIRIPLIVGSQLNPRSNKDKNKNTKKKKKTAGDDNDNDNNNNDDHENDGKSGEDRAAGNEQVAVNNIINTNNNVKRVEKTRGPLIIRAKENEPIAKIAKKLEVKSELMLKLNQSWYDNISPHSKLMKGTVLRVPEQDASDVSDADDDFPHLLANGKELDEELFTEKSCYRHWAFKTDRLEHTEPSYMMVRRVIRKHATTSTKTAHRKPRRRGGEGLLTSRLHSCLVTHIRRPKQTRDTFDCRTFKRIPRVVTPPPSPRLTKRAVRSSSRRNRSGEGTTTNRSRRRYADEGKGGGGRNDTVPALVVRKHVRIKLDSKIIAPPDENRTVAGPMEALVAGQGHSSRKRKSSSLSRKRRRVIKSEGTTCK
eukprot:jgi/Bigna1/70028/fgenesh1_pg.10_\